MKNISSGFVARISNLFYNLFQKHIQTVYKQWKIYPAAS